MKNLFLVFCALFVLTAMSFGQQLNNLATFNRALLARDTLMPYYNPGVAGNLGIRSIWVDTKDLDNDGKPEVIATDYQNNGRVHVMEVTGNKLEIVWSSPKIYGSTGSGSTPRWVRTGDLDGDGKGEIIFPISKGAADFEVQVWEWDGVTNNSFVFGISLPFNAFTAQGVGSFRTNREVANVFDADNDGFDELIMSNRDHRVYVLGISGDIPGFGGWQLEGGDPAQVPVNSNAYSISHWHSVPVDLNGDGTKEIVNHFWNFLGFSTVRSTGANTYVYPDTSLDNYYYEYMRTRANDAVSYFGIQPVDVDGDGNQEIAGLIGIGSVADLESTPYIINFSPGDNVQYGWDSTKFGMIGTNLWALAGNPPNKASLGIGAADLNNNGRQEVLIGGGFPTYSVVSLEYDGSGSILDAANYEKKIIYDGRDFNPKYIYSKLEIRDSLGVKDTLLINFGAFGGCESPFVSKMFAGCDINGNNKQEVFISYQSVVDSIEYRYTRWSGSAFVTDSIVKILNPDQVTVRMLESTVTGLKDINLGIITPDDYTLEQNYPNPFNPITSIRFSLPLQKKISIVVYDILGNEVKTLLNNQEFEKGSYEVAWDGTNNFGSHVASGQYIYTMKYGNFSKSLKMTLLK